MNDIEQQELKKENESLKEEIRLLKKKTELLSITQPLNKLSQFLIDRMDAIIFIKDVANDFRYFMVNQNFCILQNTPHHKIIGKNDYEIFTPDVADKYRRDDKIAINRKGEYTFQEEICVPGQKKVILQTTKSYVSTSEGNKLLVCIGYDITKAVEKEIKLKNAIKVEQEAHQMMRAIFHELPSAILIKDIEDDYRFYIINKKFEQMCNLPKELLIGKTDYEVFPKDEADKYRRDDTEASRYSEDAPLIINEIVTSPDRDVSTHLQTAKFSFSFKGKKLLVCVGNDVTLQHQMMEQLKNALDKAEQADRLKAQFISNMSHEIRTPLNAIVGFSQLIADATSKEEQEEYQRIVMLNNNLLLTLIEDVLNLSVLDSGKMTFNNTVFNLSEMFGDLAIQMKDKVKLPGREFIYEVPLQEVQVVHGELVAQVQLVFLHPVPHLFYALSLIFQLSGVPYQQALAQRGAQGVHGKDLPLGILLPQFLRRKARAVIGGGQAGGEGQHQHVGPGLQNGLQHIQILGDIHGGGGGHLPLPQHAVEYLRIHLPVVRPVVIGLSLHGKAQGQHLNAGLLRHLGGEICRRICHDHIRRHVVSLLVNGSPAGGTSGRLYHSRAGDFNHTVSGGHRGGGAGAP